MRIFLIITCTVSVLFVNGCAGNIQMNKKSRITGIIQACKQNPQIRKDYLNTKVKNKQISEIVSYTIQECLK